MNMNAKCGDTKEKIKILSPSPTLCISAVQKLQGAAIWHLDTTVVSERNNYMVRGMLCESSMTKAQEELGARWRRRQKYFTGLNHGSRFHQEKHELLWREKCSCADSLRPTAGEQSRGGGSCLWAHQYTVSPSVLIKTNIGGLEVFLHSCFCLLALKHPPLPSSPALFLFDSSTSFLGALYLFSPPHNPTSPSHLLLLWVHLTFQHSSARLLVCAAWLAAESWRWLIGPFRGH